MRVDLQGLTFAVVVGYTVTTMLLSLCVLMSAWKALAEEISEEMDDSSSYYLGLTNMCSETPSISTPAKPVPYTPPINPSSRPGAFASYSETPNHQLLPNLTSVRTNDVLGKVLNLAPPSPLLAAAPALVFPYPEEA